MEINVKNYKLLIEPVLRALWEIGIPVPKSEIYEKVILENDISEEFLKMVHEYKNSKVTVPEINYNIDWTLTRLKNDFGVVVNVQRGIWGIVDKQKYKTFQDLLNVVGIEQVQDINIDESKDNDSEEEISWDEQEKSKIQDALLEKVLKMDEYDFEQFCALIFIRMGCSDVQVTKKSGDHGIDGYGRYKENEIMTSAFAFQCKRYAEDKKIDEHEINSFIGACDKYKRGVFITTSSFRKNAIEKARSNSCTIDLIDGERLKSILFDLKIGYKASYVLDDELFSNYKFNK